MLFLSIRTTGGRNPHFARLEELQILDKTGTICSYDPAHLPNLSQVLVILFDAVFTLAILEKAGCRITQFEDVRLLAKVTGTVVEHRLFTPVGQRYFRYSIAKKTASDGINLYYLKELYGKLKQHLHTAAYRRERAVLPAVLEIQRNGIAFHYEGWQKYLQPKHKELTTINQFLLKSCGSLETQQLLLALQRLGVPIGSLRKEELKPYKAHPMVTQLYTKLKLEQYLTLYEQRILEYMDNGFLYAGWDNYSANSGRMTARQPNLQAFPRAARPHFHAAEGNALIACDYSQIEMRILCEMTSCKKMLGAFRNGEDIHDRTAQAVFQTNCITEKQRKIAKKVNFGIVYGITPFGLARQLTEDGLSISEKDASQLIELFLRTYPEIRDYWKTVEGLDAISSLGGRQFSTEDLSSSQRKNLAVQAAATEGFKDALALLGQEKPESYHLRMAVHDEVVVEVPEVGAKEAAELVEATMIEGMKTIVKSVPIECSTHYGRCWEKK